MSQSQCYNATVTERGRLRRSVKYSKPLWSKDRTARTAHGPEARGPVIYSKLYILHQGPFINLLRIFGNINHTHHSYDGCDGSPIPRYVGGLGTSTELRRSSAPWHTRLPHAKHNRKYKAFLATLLPQTLSLSMRKVVFRKRLLVAARALACWF